MLRIVLQLLILLLPLPTLSLTLLQLQLNLIILTLQQDILPQPTHHTQEVLYLSRQQYYLLLVLPQLLGQVVLLLYLNLLLLHPHPNALQLTLLLVYHLIQPLILPLQHQYPIRLLTNWNLIYEFPSLHPRLQLIVITLLVLQLPLQHLKTQSIIIQLILQLQYPLLLLKCTLLHLLLLLRLVLYLLHLTLQLGILLLQLLDVPT